MRVRGGRALELGQLLVEVLVEVVALDDGRVGLLQLVAVELYEYRLDVVHQLVDPREVEEGPVDGLRVPVMTLLRRDP